ncbi:MobF family relaxase [Tsukamurella ocularis]|uniref:MobF family relaxase n=1 Tax=Tsukamurella ocularis TaxID=1970234 RepID=UPI0021695AA0|nr:MobF family relaxase [Tsukamurella ocularis]MCS3853350.1 conjugative relaxase-like TrwC/TraI family protein [Tsukamurella ocularis]
MLTIARLSKWGVKYYSDTARAVTAKLDKDRELVGAGASAAEGSAEASKVSAGGGLGEYYTEHNTRTPVWITVGDQAAVEGLVGVTNGVDADNDVVDKWMQDGVAPSGAKGQKIPAEIEGKASPVHGFDLTFSAPKSISVMRGCATDSEQADVLRRAHETAVRAAMEYLAEHAGYTRVPNKLTLKKDLVKLPGLTAIAYQHETSRAGDPHLHTHVLLPNRQARADGKLVSVDSKSLYHESKAAGSIYQAVLRDEVSRDLGYYWRPVDPKTGMSELAMITKDSIRAWSKRSTRLREWAEQHYGDRGSAITQAQLEIAQKATRPVKAEELTWAELQSKWAGDSRTVDVDHAGHNAAAAEFVQRRKDLPDAALVRKWVAAADKTELTRADLVEILAAHWPVLARNLPADGVRGGIEAATAGVLLPIQASRAAHQREGSITYTTEDIVLEELEALEAAIESDEQLRYPVSETEDIDRFDLSGEKADAIAAIARSPHRVQIVQAPAGTGKTRSLKALRHIVEQNQSPAMRASMWVLAPTGKAADGAAQEGASAPERTATIDKFFLTASRAAEATGPGGKPAAPLLKPRDVVVVDEAAMVGNDRLARLIHMCQDAGAKLVLVGDSYQLQPVLARGGLFDDLHTALPWTHSFRDVFRVRSENERQAGLWLREGNGIEARAAVAWYLNNDRLTAGDEIAIADAAWNNFIDDKEAGRDTMLIAATREMVWSLNRRTQQHLHGHQAVADEHYRFGRKVSENSVPIGRDHRAFRGDTIITDSNDPDQRIAPHRRGDDVDQVRNGHRWIVHDILADGTIHAIRTHDKARVVLEPDYVREHVDLGYAATVHTAQGATTDFTHALLNAGRATRELLYVAATRGRDSNRIYVFDSDDVPDHGHRDPKEMANTALYDERTAGSFLMRIVGRTDRQRTSLAAIEHAHAVGNAAEWTERARSVREGMLRRAGVDVEQHRARAARLQGVQADVGAAQDRHRGRDEHDLER